MSSGKCKNCGGTEIDVDPSRGDAVCTNCGTVLESSAIVSEVQFEDAAHGGSSAIGQFVSSDSRGGARGFGGTFNYGIGKESREITLQNARKAVSNLGQQLHLNQHCIDTAYNFYKMALTRNLTRGRKNPHVVAACVYMTCRTEGTAHLLIDCSDVLQINVYELGRTYLKLSQALNISIPSIDPCLYVLRFANRLEFGEKTHEVSMTALRLVQRMKKDSMHTGRRPSGLCGAALLMAARMHDFSRTVDDVIKIVKVHESTLRKRLLEFGETPSSFLTLDEFMTVDLEEEQDPPSFKAARIKDRERLQKLIDDEVTPKCLTELQLRIEKVLDESKSKSRKSLMAGLEEEPESREVDRFTEESVVNVIQDCLDQGKVANKNSGETVGLGPNLDSLNLVESLDGALLGAGDAPMSRLESLRLKPLHGALLGAGDAPMSREELLRLKPLNGAFLGAGDAPISREESLRLKPLNGTLLGAGDAPISREESLRLKPLNGTLLGAGDAPMSREESLRLKPLNGTLFGAGDAPMSRVESLNGALLGVGDASLSRLSTMPEDDLTEGIDELEIDSYIMSAKEVNCKTQLWNKINADYLQAQKEKEEKLEKEKEEGKPEKKRKRTGLKKSKNCAANTAGEAINKMLKEKKISSKINYDVLKDLNVKECDPTPVYAKLAIPDVDEPIDLEAIREDAESPPPKKPSRSRPNGKREPRADHKTPKVSAFPFVQDEPAASKEVELEPFTELEEIEDFEDDTEPVESEISLHQILRRHNDSPDEFSGGYYYDDY